MRVEAILWNDWVWVCPYFCGVIPSYGAKPTLVAELCNPTSMTQVRGVAWFHLFGNVFGRGSSTARKRSGRVYGFGGSPAGCLVSAFTESQSVERPAGTRTMEILSSTTPRSILVASTKFTSTKTLLHAHTLPVAKLIHTLMLALYLAQEDAWGRMSYDVAVAFTGGCTVSRRTFFASRRTCLWSRRQRSRRYIVP